MRAALPRVEAVEQRAAGNGVEPDVVAVQTRGIGDSETDIDPRAAARERACAMALGATSRPVTR